MINRFDQILQQIHTQLSSGDLNAALNELKTWTSSLPSETRIMGNVFGSRQLDQLCVQIGDRALALRAPSAGADETWPSPAAPTHSPVEYVFVASEFYNTGGHTALVEDYIQTFPAKSARILITDPDQSADRSLIISRFSNITGDVRFSPANSSAIAKLEWLINELITANPNWTFFVNHPHDSIAVAGMQRSLSKHRAYVHHTDHTFSLGLFVPVDKHIDFRKAGVDNCRQQLGIANTCFVPLAVADQGCPDPVGRFRSNDGLITGTSGNNKFEFSYSYHLADCIPQWLATTGGRHVHIGVLSPQLEESIGRQLDDLKISRDRLSIIPWVNSLWQALLNHRVDLYIDSFPLCGCRALVEAMGAGVPVAAHHNYRHALFSNEGFAYDDAFVWSTPEELSDLLMFVKTASDTTWLESHSQKARTHFLNNHRVNSLGKSLKDLLNSRTHEALQDSQIYQLDALRAFFDGFAEQTTPLDRNEAKNMLRLASLAKALGLPAEVFQETLEAHTLPKTLNLYKHYFKGLSRQVRVMSLIDGLYPLTQGDELDKERLSRLLFAISQLESSQESPVSSRNSKLLRRCKSIFTRLASIVRSTK